MTDERLGDGLLDAVARLPEGTGVVFRHYSLAESARRALFDRVRGAHDGLLLLGFALAFQIPDEAQARVNLVVNVLRHQDHFLNDPLLVVELGERMLQLLIKLLEFLVQARPHALG